MTVRDDDVRRAAEALRDGRPVVLPTDTVYGVAADPRNEDAVRRVFELKGRPDTNPLPLLVPSIEDAQRCAAAWPEAARRLADAFWPGPLTIVVAAAGWIPEAVTAGAATVGLRQPDHAVALQLLREFGGPLACTSANLSGEPPVQRIEDLPPAFLHSDVSRLYGGLLPASPPSTVATVSDNSEIQVLREGPIPLHRLQSAIEAPPRDRAP